MFCTRRAKLAPTRMRSYVSAVAPSAEISIVATQTRQDLGDALGRDARAVRREVDALIVRVRAFDELQEVRREHRLAADAQVEA
jgi:hypothetical protein